MKRLLRPSYDQCVLFPTTLEEMLPAEHPARFVRDFVAELPLHTYGIAPPSLSGPGSSPYDPAMLLALCLYGYLERIRSSRQLEKACYNHLGFIWLAGQCHPDHNTFANFLKAHRQAFKQIFRALTKVTHQLGLISLVLHALDGTKIAAACSKEGALHANSLTELLAKVEAAVEEIQTQMAHADAQEADRAVVLPTALAEAAARKAQIQAALATLEEAETKHLAPSEPEARMVKCRDGSFPLGYNAQLVVDATHGLIVAEDVVNAECDNAQLVPMLDQVAATLGGVADETLADGGYFAGEQLQTAEEQAYPVLVNLTGVGASSAAPGYQKADFHWDADRQEYRCPQGQRLPFLKRKAKKRTNGQPYQVEIYQCRQCATCPVRATCTKSRTGRTIERMDYEAVVERQRAKQADPAKGALLSRRSALVERVFAVIKGPLGFRRWTVAGLTAVRAQWSFLCLTYNLKVLMQLWRRGLFELTKLGTLFRQLAPT
jgi:transposase